MKKEKLYKKKSRRDASREPPGSYCSLRTKCWTDNRTAVALAQ